MPARRVHPSLLHKLRVEIHAAWLAARDPRTPWYARLFGLALTAYALSPLDLIPDFIPVLGLADEAVILPIGVWLFEKMLPAGVMAECRAQAELITERPRSWIGAVGVVLLWLLAAWLVYRLLAPIYD